MKLFQGDCLEIMKDTPDGSVDMVMADPPYGTTACKWDSIIPLEPMWEQLKRVIKKNGAIVLTASQPFTTVLISSNMGMFKYEWIWDKHRPTGAFMAKKIPMKVHENILLFYTTQPGYNPQKENRDKKNIRKNRIKNSLIKSYSSSNIYDFKDGNFANDFDEDKTYPKTIISIPNIDNFSGKRVHPTQKPIALMEYLIKTYTNEGETVLDFCMGSGTTGEACINLCRNFIGIEKDTEYFRIAEERINNVMPLFQAVNQ